MSSNLFNHPHSAPKTSHRTLIGFEVIPSPLNHDLEKFGDFSRIMFQGVHIHDIPFSQLKSCPPMDSLFSSVFHLLIRSILYAFNHTENGFSRPRFFDIYPTLSKLDLVDNSYGFQTCVLEEYTFLSRATLSTSKHHGAPFVFFLTRIILSSY